MAVAPDRLVLIGELANDERVDRLGSSYFDDFTDADWERFQDEMDEEASTFCRDCSDPEELHAFVEQWNWDKGIGPLNEIIRNPACETATALMAYWMADPEGFLPSADREAVLSSGDDVERFDFITDIETRYLSGGFARGKIAYDPGGAEECRVGQYDNRRDTFVRALPTIMYLPVPRKPA